MVQAKCMRSLINSDFFLGVVEFRPVDKRGKLKLTKNKHQKSTRKMIIVLSIVRYIFLLFRCGLCVFKQLQPPTVDIINLACDFLAFFFGQILHTTMSNKRLLIINYFNQLIKLYRSNWNVMRSNIFIKVELTPSVLYQVSF